MAPSLARKLALPVFALLLPVLLLSIGYISYHNLLQGVVAQALRDEEQPADAIVIFGAAIGAGGEPGTILKSRINQGFALWKKGLARSFIATGGIGWGPPAEAVVIRRELIRLGVPAEAVHPETRSRTTREQAAFAADFAARAGWKRLLLVSDPLHMYRLKLLFADSGLSVYCAPGRSLRMGREGLERYLRMEVLKILAMKLFGDNGRTIF